jgi:hypothetical protein
MRNLAASAAQKPVSMHVDFTSATVTARHVFREHRSSSLSGGIASCGLPVVGGDEGVRREVGGFCTNTRQLSDQRRDAPSGYLWSGIGAFEERQLTHNMENLESLALLAAGFSGGFIFFRGLAQHGSLSNRFFIASVKRLYRTVAIKAFLE